LLESCTTEKFYLKTFPDLPALKTSWIKRNLSINVCVTCKNAKFHFILFWSKCDELCRL
jgi:hypothetical protein